MTDTERLEQAVASACRQAGVALRRLRLVRHFANVVFLLDTTSGPLIARVTSVRATARARTGVRTAACLADVGFPATEPALLPPAEQPVIVDEQVVVTFWVYYPQDEKQVHTVEELACLARELHALPPPPALALPAYEPLQSFPRDRLHALRSGDRIWLLDHLDRLVEQYHELDFELEAGMIHADLYMGNLLTDGDRAVLGDWDSVSLGPREIDLVPTFTAARFGLPREQIDRFATAYGHDLRDWSGWPTLREIRELSTLSALIKLAPADPQSARQLRHRLDTLRAGDAVATWQAN